MQMHSSPKITEWHWVPLSGLFYSADQFLTCDGYFTPYNINLEQLVNPLVECKWSDADLGRGLRYLKSRFPNADAWQISAAGTKDYATPQGIRAAPALKLLSTLV